MYSPRLAFSLKGVDRFARGRWGAFISSVACVVSFAAGEGQRDLEARVLKGIDQAQELREHCLAGYTVTERYTIRNSHFDGVARMVVSTEYRKGAGKSYQIISRSGPSVLRGRVFDSLLRAESEMSRGAVREDSLIITRNYHMRLLGTENIGAKKCYVVELNPKRRSSHVLRGRAWFTFRDYNLVRIEGQPSASPSFWIGRPRVTRDYQPIDGIWLACKSQAHSEGLFTGRTDLTLEYVGYNLSLLAAQKLDSHAGHAAMAGCTTAPSGL